MNRTFEVNKEITLFGKHKVYLWQISQYHGIARRNYPYHYHNYYELSLAVHGKTLFMVNGKSFTCEPGQAALVAPNCLHSAMIDSLEESDFVWTFRFQMDPNSSFAQQTNMCTYIISLNNKTEFLNSLLCQWADLEQKSAYASEYVYPCALLLLQMIFEELEHNAVAYEDRSDPQYRYVLQYIMKNYLNGFSLDDLANHFFISKSHFMRCFKQNFGISPIHYRNELLINASCSGIQIPN